MGSGAAYVHGHVSVPTTVMSPLSSWSEIRVGSAIFAIYGVALLSSLLTLRVAGCSSVSGEPVIPVWSEDVGQRWCHRGWTRSASSGMLRA